MTFFEEISNATDQANKGSAFYSGSDFYLGPVTGVFGRDGGADYARHICKDLKTYILDEAKSRRLGVTIFPPVTGPSAQEGFLHELKELLPDFTIEWRANSVVIGWAPSQPG